MKDSTKRKGEKQASHTTSDNCCKDIQVNEQADREKEHRIPIVVLHERYTKFEDAYVVIKAEHFCKHYKDIPIQDTAEAPDSSIIRSNILADVPIGGNY